MIRIYNSMSHQLEEFKPIEEKKVKMYLCGPTVYNYIHIGNARSLVAFDLIRRYLEFRQFKVNFVSNFTDVDDKIIAAAKLENISVLELSERYISAFFEDAKALSVKKASQHPRATEYIDDMVKFIEELIEKDFAYVSKSDVYFRVAKSQDYGRLANKNLDELIEGASGRLSEDVSLKESSADFALWKVAKEGEQSWDSPWGKGRPGWHIECSVMANLLLAETIDIHAGGADLEFPHHTNEIAQSEAHNGKKFVNYWLHNGFVNVSGEKMSKSLGNFKTVRELLESGIDPQVLRLFLVSQHYRRPLDFTEEALEQSENNLKKILNVFVKFEEDREINEEELEKFKREFILAMDEDFNIANGLTVFYDFIKWVNKGNTAQAAKDFYLTVLELLGIHTQTKKEDLRIEELVAQREFARQNKDFVVADKIRDDLKAEGILLEDTAKGVRWSYE
ncbi:MAG: cysteine--tRNA ligase [Lactovum sp.]